MEKGFNYWEMQCTICVAYNFVKWALVKSTANFIDFERFEAFEIFTTR